MPPPRIDIFSVVTNITTNTQATQSSLVLQKSCKCLKLIKIKIKKKHANKNE